MYGVGRAHVLLAINTHSTPVEAAVILASISIIDLSEERSNPVWASIRVRALCKYFVSEMFEGGKINMNTLSRSRVSAAVGSCSFACAFQPSCLSVCLRAKWSSLCS